MQSEPSNPYQPGSGPSAQARDESSHAGGAEQPNIGGLVLTALIGMGLSAASVANGSNANGGNE